MQHVLQQGRELTTQWTDRQPGMFDVCKCVERQLQNSFDQVVNALVSNDKYRPERKKQVSK